METFTKILFYVFKYLNLVCAIMNLAVFCNHINNICFSIIYSLIVGLFNCAVYELMNWLVHKD